MESWQPAARGVERMSSNPEKCGRAGGWEERPRGGHGEELGKGGREEGGAGGGPGAACGPQLGPHLGQVLPGLGSSSPSSKNSRGCRLPAGTISPSITHPSTPTVPSATSPSPPVPFVPVPCPRCHPGEPPVPVLAASPGQGTPQWPQWDQVLCPSPAPGAHGVQVARSAALLLISHFSRVCCRGCFRIKGLHPKRFPPPLVPPFVASTGPEQPPRHGAS